MKDIAFKAIMTMQCLLLQKPYQKSKSRDHFKALERNTEQGTSRQILELLNEGEMIQKDLKSPSMPSSIAEVSRIFSREMSNGNVTNAMKLLSDNMQNSLILDGKDDNLTQSLEVFLACHLIPLRQEPWPSPNRYTRNVTYD